MKKKPKLPMPKWCTVVYPSEYDYLAQFSEMVKLANKNKEIFCEMDVGKVWGLVLEIERLKQELDDVHRQQSLSYEDINFSIMG